MTKFEKFIVKVETNKPLWLTVDVGLGIIIAVSFIFGAIKIFG